MLRNFFVYLSLVVFFTAPHCDSVKIFVAISPGLPKAVDNAHIREVAVHITGLNATLLGESTLVLARDAEFRSVLKRIKVYDEIEDDENPSEGRVFTGFVIPPTNFSAKKPFSECVGYFVRLEWKSRSVASACLRVYPDWMSELVDQEPATGEKNAFVSVPGNLTLNALAIPGTHNAGAYRVYDASSESVVTWYRDCQEEDIYSQLLYGSRFLDIRPGVVTVNNTRTYWVFHAAFRTDNLLEKVLDDVKLFLDEHKREIVFIDFHEFPWGFKTTSDYAALGDIVEGKLGPYMLQYRPHMITLNEAIALNQRAVVTFDQDDALARRFLPGVNHAWANTDNLDNLSVRLRMMQLSRSEGNRLYSAMAQITPKGAWNIILDKYQGGVRGLSHRNNFKVLSWWRNSPEYQSTTNLIAMDYLTSSSVVDLCRDINLERGGQLSKRQYHAKYF
ncbi:PI-PLC X domain-containing protein 3 [Galendromus occidentalis]|uniref:PI-PLC X domain-containing protein 3 n=1 Tax=Galendromus occidentalis TaxID=34638 RepID=A0AAJ7SFX3_9ACAR|nr:PI-PLC X domain-containing protein 3 [Galendromus occidentalis]